MKHAGKVISLFDGMSGFQMALVESGMTYDSYYASEVSKEPIRNCMANFPKTVQLGDIRDIDVKKLGVVFDTVAGGSPCQSFSFAGRRNGMTTTENIEVHTLEHYLQLKAEKFEFVGQSYLFWEYVRILRDVREMNPNVKFILENVKMTKHWERILSNAIGVFGVHIDSALVCCQHRKRIYWTNFRTKQVGLFGELHSDIPQPADRGILLRDIIESNVPEKYYLSETAVHYMKRHGNKSYENIKSACIEANTYKRSKHIQLVSVIPCDYRSDEGLRIKEDGKTGTLCARAREDESCVQLMVECVAQRGREGQQEFEFRGDGKTNAITTVCKDNLMLENGVRLRRLTPTECAKAQTIPSWYKLVSKDSPTYEMIGNGFNIQTFVHILQYY